MCLGGGRSFAPQTDLVLNDRQPRPARLRFLGQPPVQPFRRRVVAARFVQARAGVGDFRPQRHRVRQFAQRGLRRHLGGQQLFQLRQHGGGALPQRGPALGPGDRVADRSRVGFPRPPQRLVRRPGGAAGVGLGAVGGGRLGLGPFQRALHVLHRPFAFGLDRFQFRVAVPLPQPRRRPRALVGAPHESVPTPQCAFAADQPLALRQSPDQIGAPRPVDQADLRKPQPHLLRRINKCAQRLGAVRQRRRGLARHVPPVRRRGGIAGNLQVVAQPGGQRRLVSGGDGHVVDQWREQIVLVDAQQFRQRAPLRRHLAVGGVHFLHRLAHDRQRLVAARPFGLGGGQRLGGVGCGNPGGGDFGDRFLRIRGRVFGCIHRPRFDE